MTTTHKKSIKELINWRLSGDVYRRQPQTTDYRGGRSSLQNVAESILLQNDQKEGVEELFIQKSQKIQELNNAIINNSVQNSSPMPGKIHTPTILQRLNPTQNMRKSAYVAVAEAQTVIAKESIGIVEMQKVQIKQAQVKQVSTQQSAPAKSFGRVPKFLSNY